MRNKVHNSVCCVAPPAPRRVGHLHPALLRDLRVAQSHRLRQPSEVMLHTQRGDPFVGGLLGCGPTPSVGGVPVCIIQLELFRHHLHHLVQKVELPDRTYRSWKEQCAYSACSGCVVWVSFFCRSFPPSPHITQSIINLTAIHTHHVEAFRRQHTKPEPKKKKAF